MIRSLKILHWLNLDTAAGAAVTSMFIAKSLGTEIIPTATLTLFIAVLAIYNFDHQLDARNIKSIATASRHKFYQANLKTLSIYQLLLMFTLLTLVWYLPEPIMRAGIILGLFTLIYFLLLFIVFAKRFLMKEVFISVVFSLAVFLAPVYAGTNEFHTLFIVLLWAQVFLLALANTLILSWYDYELDASEGHSSLAVAIGMTAVQRIIIIVLVILTTILVLQLAIREAYLEQFIILIMEIVLLGSIKMKDRLMVGERYRFIIDAIFMIPIIALI